MWTYCATHHRGPVLHIKLSFSAVNIITFEWKSIVVAMVLRGDAQIDEGRIVADGLGLGGWVDEHDAVAVAVPQRLVRQPVGADL